jgi:hypothetical protein
MHTHTHTHTHTFTESRQTYIHTHTGIGITHNKLDAIIGKFLSVSHSVCGK